MMACVRPRTLKLQPVRLAASRALCTAGRSRPISVAMIAITTKSSTRVKPRRFELWIDTDMRKTSAQMGCWMKKSRIKNCGNFRTGEIEIRMCRTQKPPTHR